VTIRDEQVQAFSGAAVSAFKDRVALHLRRFFPSLCHALGETGIHQTIRLGVNAAAAYGILAERDVCKYIDLMFAAGHDFDRSPWAIEILKNPAITDPAVRIDLLCDAMEENRGTSSGR
jgi:hypothetical protein